MRKVEFEKCCQNIEKGSEIYMQNVVNHETGKVLFCTSNRFHVDMNGKRDSWLPQICEITSKDIQ